MALVLSLILAAATPAAAEPAPDTLTTQALFDQGTAAAVRGECKKALGYFDILDKRKALKPGTLPEAVTLLRRGTCLVWMGQVTEGQGFIRRSLPVLEKAGPDFNLDVADGNEAMGDGAMTFLDYDSAVANYQRALALRTGATRLPTLVRLAKVTAFDGGRTSLAYAEEGIALLSAKPEKERNKDSLAAFHTLHARTLLNQGQVTEGYAELKKALALSGGLTSRTSLSEVSMRSDLGMAAALAGKKDDARLYFAYTGAGRIGTGSFRRGTSMDPPLCGEETGLRPEDVAVVELSLGDDGRVDGANTVYSRGNRSAAIAFAKAARDWQWTPESLKDIPAFYRMVTRIEVRCSQSAGDGPSVVSPARTRFWTWAMSQLAGDVKETDGDLTDQLRALIARNAFETKPMQRAAALAVIASDPRGSAATVIADADRAIAAATEAKAPIETLNWLRLTVASASDRSLDRKARLALRALAADPAFAGDALSADTALMLSALKERGPSNTGTPEVLAQVASDDRLTTHHPLRQAARLSLANIAAAAGDIPTAQSYFAATGLTEQQCALIGVRPALRSSGADSSDYPMEAVRMGFEGWVSLEFDVSADGRAVGARPIAAYPPLIFVDAVVTMAKDFRYQTSYRPAGGAACAANRQTISFSRPNG